jgi:hypothetical protein
VSNQRTRNAKIWRRNADMASIEALKVVIVSINGHDTRK